MNPLSVDIKDRLVTKGVGTFATDIFIDSMPREPDNVVVIIDADGGPPQRTMSAVRTDATLDHDIVQIQVRNSDYANAYAKMREVVDALEKGGIRWTATGPESGDADVAVEGVFAMGGIQSLGRDDGDRYILSRNYRAVRREKL